MNPKERMFAAIRGDKIDRVPLDLPGFTYASEEDIDRCPDPRRREIAHRVFPETAYFKKIENYADHYLVTPWPRIKMTQKDLSHGKKRITGEIDTPKGILTFVREYNPGAQTWWRLKYPVESMEDIDRIRSVPWELPDVVIPPDGSHVTEGFQERGILQTNIPSPLICVIGLMKKEWFLEMTLTESALIRELTDICRLRILDILKAMFAKPGIEYVRISGSESVTPPMGSPALYDTLVHEPERSIIDFIHEQGDIPVHAHCHGNVRHALTRCVERHIDYTEPVEPPPDGDITMAEAKRLVDGQMALGGNVECRVLCNESEETVEQATRAAFEGGKRRFVLRPTEGPSSELPEREFRNTMRMIDVWEELSPINHDSAQGSSV